jgi:methionine-rich copper-binding protein CopC
MGAFARDKNQRTVEISEVVQVGETQLQPGTYKVEWQGTGPQVQVNFTHNGKTVATVPGTLKTNANVAHDEIVTQTTSANAKSLQEIDFHHNNESVTFAQSGM